MRMSPLPILQLFLKYTLTRALKLHMTGPAKLSRFNFSALGTPAPSTHSGSLLLASDSGPQMIFATSRLAT